MVANSSALDLTSLLGSAFDALSRLTLRESSHGKLGRKAAIHMPQTTNVQAVGGQGPRNESPAAS
jgi:hypothetical protein